MISSQQVKCEKHLLFDFNNLKITKMDVCVICNAEDSVAGQLQKIYKKGYESLVKQCQRINDISLLERLEHKWINKIPINVHRRCRNLFLQKEQKADEQELAPRQKRPRLSQAGTDEKEQGK